MEQGDRSHRHRRRLMWALYPLQQLLTDTLAFAQPFELNSLVRPFGCATPRLHCPALDRYAVDQVHPAAALGWAICRVVFRDRIEVCACSKRGWS
ncbi:hypothetical protein QBC43DRAFT_107452 [Cladorrhinum sp. PSN259]|nr:hypothetical protein QBC43DRAFT_107452 [Cladorrhinum sp. PSN259]